MKTVLLFVVLSQAHARSLPGNSDPTKLSTDSEGYQDDDTVGIDDNAKSWVAPDLMEGSEPEKTEMSVVVPPAPVKVAVERKLVAHSSAVVPRKPAAVVAAKVAAPKAKAPKSKVALMSYSPRISPPLHDGGVVKAGEHQSDKKFFGPPFPADYPEDKRPVPDKAIMDKLRGPGQPYPALQSKHDYDRDYVKDENSDTGAWKAQFEYDTLRNKMAKEAADQRNSQARADQEGGEADDAQRKADAAGKDVDDAKKGVDDANRVDDFKRAEDFEDVPPSAAKLEEMKKAVAQAEANYENEKKQFEECKRQLEEAKKNLEELKAAQAVMEKQLATDTKLWVESKSVRMSAHKSKEEAAHTKKVAADAKLNEVKASKADLDKVLAAKKAQHAKAMKSLQKEQSDVAQAKTDLEKATLTLQKLRGYKPASVEPTKSSAPMAFSLSALMAMLLAM